MKNTADVNENSSNKNLLKAFADTLAAMNGTITGNTYRKSLLQA